MDLIELIATRIRRWPRERQRQLARIVEEMDPDSAPEEVDTVRGLWADFEVDVSNEQIQEAREELFGDFPRRDV